MSAFDECGVLIPAATLEDFPSDLSDYDARSLLAAWTVLWHPRLLADQGQIPTWYRADSPPDPVGRRILTVPSPSLAQLPDRYETKCLQSEGCQWITGSDRREMLAALGLQDSPPPVAGKSRQIGVDDFFAAGFAILQVQVMTRRLRYTSNLDEIHLQNRIVAAAKSFLDQDGQAAIEAMHDVFDCLAEERDHYFSSDPHLVDLVLMADTTIDSFFQQHASAETVSPSRENGTSGDDQSKDESGIGADDSAGVLPTPQNVLLDRKVCQALASQERSRLESLRRALAQGDFGWAGGGPEESHCLDTMTFNQAEAVFRQASLSTEQELGMLPTVFARLSGGTPSDLTGTLVRLGYQGSIPIDFAAGSGFGDEAKVMVRGGGAEIESLTAKPIDAAGDSAFLSLGAKLGEAIDSGEIATALLAHWPGQGCDSFHDLRRVASWSLALGKFWKLDDYFVEGEHPYHHGNHRAASADADQHLSQQVAAEATDPLRTAADEFRRVVEEETRSKLAGLSALICSDSTNVSNESFAKAIGRPAAEDQGQSKKKSAVLLINPNNVGWRDSVQLDGAADPNADHIYGASTAGSTSTVTVDVPACGFAVVEKAGSRSSGGFSLGKLFGLGGSKAIAEQNMLRNEFMEVSISPESGGIAGVYSGGARGNRFSMRLVRRKKGEKAQSVAATMRCNDLRIGESSAAKGTLEVEGVLVEDENKTEKTLAEFKLAYSLCRGSRFLSVSGQITPSGPLTAEPWQDYFAARVAVANESSIFRPLLRDKVHRARGRRLVCPLGVVIDEAERQTLVAADGLPYHVRVGDRFLDTLLAVRGESQPTFQLNYGFDVTNPVAAAKTLIAPPVQIPVETGSGQAPLGWLMHSSPKEIELIGLNVGRRADGRLAALARVVQTRSKSCTAVLRFIHNVEHAQLIEELCEEPLEHPLGEQGAPAVLQTKDDQVSLPMAGHQVSDLLLVFAGDAKR